MEGHAKKCEERYYELANKTTQQLYKVSTPCIDDHHFKEEETKSVGELSQVCSQIVLKCLYLARIGRLDILWSVNKLARSRSKKEVIDEARTSDAKVHFVSLMDICHLKNAELEAKHQKYKGRVVLRGDIVKDDSGSHAVFTEQGWSASQMTAAKVMDIISRLPGWDGQAADAVSAYTKVKMEDAHKLLKIPKSECPDIWIRLPRHKWPMSWSSSHYSQTKAVSWNDQWFGLWWFYFLKRPIFPQDDH